MPHPDAHRIVLRHDYDPMEINAAILLAATHFDHLKVDLPATGKAAHIKLNQVLLLLDAHGYLPCPIRAVGSRWILVLHGKRRLAVAA